MPGHRIFWIWFAGMVPFFACPFHFKLELVDSAFFSTHHVLQEAVAFCFISLQKFSGRYAHGFHAVQESAV
jgi:hypothetical protein